MTSKLTITRERLSGIARGESCYTHDDVIELALAQLAAMDSEPVAVPDHLTYLQSPTLENVLSDAEENSPMAHAARILAREVKFWRSVPLYRHAQQPVVPDKMTAIVKDEAEYVEGWNDCRAAMLAAAPQLPGNDHATVPGKWIPVSEHLPDPKSEQRVCVYTPTPHEDMRYRFVPASLFRAVCSDATHWYYMEPPAAPQEVNHG